MTHDVRVNTPTTTKTPGAAYTPPWRDLVDRLDLAVDTFTDAAHELEQLLDVLSDEDGAPNDVQDEAGRASYACSSARSEVTSAAGWITGAADWPDDGTDPDNDDLFDNND
jgi:hypothetical protein